MEHDIEGGWGRTAEDIEGWMTGPELRWLRKQAATSPITVEVGVWRGRSTFAIAEAHRQSGGISFAVDHFAGAREIMKAHDELGSIEGVREMARRNLAEPISEGLVVLVELESTVAYQHLFHVLGAENADFVFIDGSHHYGPAMLDVSNYWNLVRPGGTIAGHDWNLDSVKRAVHDSLGPNINAGPDSIWFTKKGTN